MKSQSELDAEEKGKTEGKHPLDEPSGFNAFDVSDLLDYDGWAPAKVIGARLPNQAPASREEEDLLLASGYSEEHLERLSDGEKHMLAADEYVSSGFLRAEKAAVKKVWHSVSGLWEDAGNPNFNLDESLARDGFYSDDDKKFFDGVKTERDYEYIKSGLNRERALSKYYDALPGVDKWVASIGKGLNEVATIWTEMVALKGIGASLSVAAPETVGAAVSKYETMMQHLPKPILRDVVNSVLVGTADGFKEYASQYEFSEEDMVAHVGGWVACGLAFSALRDGLKATSEAFASAYDTRTLGERLDDYFVQGKKLSAMQKFHRFMDTNKVTGSPVYRLLWNEHSDLLRDYARKMCIVSEGQGASSQEIWMLVQRNKLNYISEKNFSALEPLAKKIEEQTGKSLIRWLDYAIENKGEGILPFDGGETVNKFARQLLQLRSEITQGLEKDIVELSNGKIADLGLPGIGGDYLSSKLAVEKNLSGQKLIDEYLNGSSSATVRPVYVPRKYNRAVLGENKEKFLGILRNGKLNEYFQGEVKKAFGLPEEEEITAELVRKLYKKAGSDSEAVFAKIAKQCDDYSATAEFNQVVEGQYNDLIDELSSNSFHGHTDEFLKRMRTIRVDDAALTEFFGTSAFEGVYADTERLIMLGAHKKTLASLGARDNEEFLKMVSDEIKGKVGDVKYTSKEFESELKELKNSFNLLSGLFTRKPLDMVDGSTLFGLQRCLCGLRLGKTVINSLGDGAMMLSRFGLIDYIRKASLGLPGIVEKGLREIPKSEMKEILDALPFGITDGAKDYLSRMLPGIMDFGYGLAYRGNRFARFGQALSSATYRYTGLEAWDFAHKRIVRQAVIQQLRKNPGLVKELTSEELERQLSTHEISDEVAAYITNKTMATINRPAIIDTPEWGYHKLGKLFFTFKSWSFAYVRNFLRPLLNGDFGVARSIEGLAHLVTMCGIGEYIKSIVAGKRYDLNNENGFYDWLSATCKKGFDDVAGYYVIAASLANSFIGYNKRSPGEAFIRQNAPLLSWGYDLTAALTASISDLFVKLDSGYFPKNSKQHIKRLLNATTPNWWQKETVLNNFVFDDLNSKTKGKKQKSYVSTRDATW